MSLFKALPGMLWVSMREAIRTGWLLSAYIAAACIWGYYQKLDWRTVVFGDGLVFLAISALAGLFIGHFQGQWGHWRATRRNRGRDVAVHWQNGGHRFAAESAATGAMLMFASDAISETSVADDSSSSYMSVASGFDSSDSNTYSMPETVINPATGLPMVGDSYGGVDVGGNTYGTDSATYHDTSYTDTSWSDSCCSDTSWSDTSYTCDTSWSDTSSSCFSND